MQQQAAPSLPVGVTGITVESYLSSSPTTGARTAPGPNPHPKPAPVKVAVAENPLTTLIRKNLTLKKRRPCSTATEFLLPLSFVLLFALLKSTTQIAIVNDGWFTEVQQASDCPFPIPAEGKNRSCPYPYATFFRETPFFNEIAKDSIDSRKEARVLFAAKATDQLVHVNALRNYMASAVRTNFIESTAVFMDGLEEQAEEYMRSEAYGRPFNASEGKPEVAAVVVINEFNFATLKFDYTIRVNGSGGSQTLRSPATGYGRPPTDDVQRNLNWWATRRYAQDGFMSLQHLIDSFLITNGSQAWERYAPQPPAVAAFPVREYPYDEFFGYVESIFALAYLLAFLYPVAQLISALVTEKELRMREYMKITGISESQVILSWYVTYSAYFFVLSILITIMSISLFPGTTRKGGLVLVWLLFLLFGLCTLAFCFLISSLFAKSRTASIAGTVLFFAMFFVYFAITSEEGTYKPPALMLFPQTAFGLIIKSIASLEADASGLGFDNINTPVDGFVPSLGYSMLTLDFILYTMLGWYLNEVWPWGREFGKPRHPLFMFRSLCDNPAARAPAHRVGRGRTIAAAQYPPHVLVEPVDAAYTAQLGQGRALQIRGLSKTYDDGKKALNDFDMDVFEGHITCLLGVNGAGKSTLINCLTGMLVPTSGTASVRGFDLLEDMDMIRYSLGYCPQHDVLYRDMTVKEHLEFFGRLKGLQDGRELDSAVEAKIHEVGLTEKRYTLSSQLSGGQRRKLSLALAFIGNSSVVILDEVTSGVDVYSRRAMWNLIQGQKPGRIIIVTTHFMDEAEILGDRIAIMGDGKMRCCGSSIFLKNRFGLGYSLSLVRRDEDAGEGGPRSRHRSAQDEAVRLVRSHIPDGVFAGSNGPELAFHLPMSASPRFPGLFRALDKSLDSLGLTSYGVSCTTMDDVFIRASRGEVAEPTATSMVPAPNADTSLEQPPPPVESLKAANSFSVSAFTSHQQPESLASDRVVLSTSRRPANFFHMFYALLAKRILYARRDWRSFLCATMLPILLFALGLTLLKFQPFGRDSTEYVLSPNDFNPAGYEPNVFLPTVELDFARNSTPGLILENDLVNPEVALEFPTVPLVDGDVELFHHEYSDGLIADEKVCVAGGCYMQVPQFTGQAVLGLGKSLIENAPNERYMGASVYLGLVLRDMQVGLGRRCRKTVFSSTGSFFASTLCKDAEDSCLYAEVQNLDPALLIPPALVPGDVTLPAEVDLCLPVGCEAEVLETLLEFGNDTLGAWDEITQTSPLFFTFSGTPSVSAPGALFRCNHKNDCNREPGISAIFAGESTCRGSPRGNGDTCAADNTTPVKLNQTSEVFVRDKSIPLCKASEEEEAGARARALLDGERNLAPWTGPACSSVGFSNCTVTPGCELLLSIGAVCATKCSEYTSLGEAGCVAVGLDSDVTPVEANQVCSWNELSSECYPSCRLAASSFLCASVDWSGADCEWVGGRCQARHRLKATIMVNSTSRHGAPILQNIVNQALLRRRIKATLPPGNNAYTGATITTRTHPFPLTANIKVYISGLLAFIASIFAVIAFAFIPSSIAGYVVMEQELVKHQQFVSGASILAYWSSLFVFDMAAYLVPMCASLLLMQLFELDSFTKNGAFGAVAVALLSYGLAVIPLTYVMAHAFSKHTTAMNLTLMFGLVFGLVLMITSFVLGQLEDTAEANESLVFIYRIFPGYCLGETLQNLAINSVAAALFGQAAEDSLPDAFALDVTGYNILYMLGSSVFWSLVVVVMDILLSYPRIAQRLRPDPVVSEARERLLHTPQDVDPDVERERKRVLSGANADHDVLRLVGLRKVYRARASPAVAPGDAAGGVTESVRGAARRKDRANFKVAVKGTTLGLRRGEAFGLIGLNGCGVSFPACTFCLWEPFAICLQRPFTHKYNAPHAQQQKSTTMGMITGFTFPSAGTATLDGLDILAKPREVRRLIGYCPQFDPILPLLTVREHLQLIGRIRGIVGTRELARAVDDSMRELTLAQYADKRAGALSGGNKRKLSLAMSTIGNPPVLLADEPSSGWMPGRVAPFSRCSRNACMVPRAPASC